MAKEKALNDAQEQIVQLVKQGQETAVAAVKVWADTVQSTVPVVLERLQSEEYAERLTKAVDDAFETASKVLGAQREFVQGLVDAMEPAVKSVREQLDKATR
jgi:hypothetical protein